MEYLYNYLIFLGEVATLVAAILIVVAGISAIAAKGKEKHKGKLTVKKLNERFNKTRDTIQQHILDKKALKAHKKDHKKKSSKKGQAKNQPNLFVIKFNGDIKASAVNALREEITAILLSAKPNDEVLICLESGGGIVNAYGLGASQLQRLRDANIKLTVAVDKVAASGGYMMACVADQIIAAPFAIIGSIGVVAQLPNFHRYLEKKNIDFEQLTAGEYKRTLTLFGENTKQGRAKMQQDIDDTQILFKDFIKQHRAQVDINKVATGEHWYGTDAIKHQLIDSIKTSDDYILNRRDDYAIYHIEYKTKKSFSKKLSSGASNLIDRVLYHGT
ncbi:MAG: protease SohB [Gammaproteobacteria bacterium]|nr:protease SohB [Gammaproteobacteria bacterium]